RLEDAEWAPHARPLGVDADRLDARERWCFGGEPCQELVDRGRLTLDFDLHSALVVQHPPTEPQLLGETEDVGAKSNSLNDPGNPGPHPTPLGCSRRQRHGSL